LPYGAGKTHSPLGGDHKPTKDCTGGNVNSERVSDPSGDAAVIDHKQPGSSIESSVCHNQVRRNRDALLVCQALPIFATTDRTADKIFAGTIFYDRHIADKCERLISCFEHSGVVWLVKGFQKFLLLRMD